MTYKLEPLLPLTGHESFTKSPDGTIRARSCYGLPGIDRVFERSFDRPDTFIEMDYVRRQNHFESQRKQFLHRCWEENHTVRPLNRPSILDDGPPLRLSSGTGFGRP